MNAVKNLDGAEYRKVKRSELRDAVYNPRSIDPVARKRLIASIKDTGGLIETPVWNKRTGNLVAGHQRLSVCDERAGGVDYEVTVAVIDVDEKKERELNVRLNSPDLRGAYDAEALIDLINETPGFEIEDAGLGRMTFEDILASGGFDPPDVETPTEVVDATKELLSIQDEADRSRKEEKRIEDIKKDRQDFKASQEFERQTDIAITLVFPDEITKHAFCRAIGEPPRADRADGMIVAVDCGLDLAKYMV